MLGEEARRILDATGQLRARGTPFLVATVVSVRGSSYRREGARLVATHEGRVAGSVSGGCLEGDLVRTGFFRARRGPVVVRYDSADTDGPSARLGCGGEVDVLLETNDSDALDVQDRALAAGSASVLITVFDSTTASIPIAARARVAGGKIEASVPELARLEVVAREGAAVLGSRRPRVVSFTVQDGSRVDALVEPVVPPPHLFVFGAGTDALPVASAVLCLGWSVTVWEPHARIDTRARFVKTGARLVTGDLGALKREIAECDRPLAIVMGHNVDHDRAALSMLSESRAHYIGVLGPRHRAVTLGVDLTDARVHSPVGLDLGAETPEEIALSVSAELLAFIRGRAATPLRSSGTIHG